MIYGGTSAAVIAAVQATDGQVGRHRLPGQAPGRPLSGGLGFTDTGNKAVIGGLSREFYHRVWKHYDRPAAWRWQKREEYGNKGQGTPAIDGEQRTMWIFEPHVAEQVFEDFVKEYEIPVVPRRVARPRQGREEGRRPHRLDHDARAARPTPAKMFIDATYEGDLMAAAGVDYHVGREANAIYGEQWNGVQTGVLHHRHHFGALQDADQPLRRARRSQERRAAAHQHRAAGRVRRRATRGCRPTASACA